MQAAQNKCIRFYLKVEERKSITVKEFEVEENINAANSRKGQSVYTLLYI